jgi:methyltransferase
MTPLYAIIGYMAVLRVAELTLSAYNTRWLKARGAIEVGAGHYPLFILLHGSWLLAILFFTPPGMSPDLGFLALLILMQLARAWVIVSLGRFWTTRIITLPDAPLITKGPYRYVHHPNYIIVMIEMAALPLAFHDGHIALIWSVANAMLLLWRLKVENAALEGRKRLND